MTRRTSDEKYTWIKEDSMLEMKEEVLKRNVFLKKLGISGSVLHEVMMKSF